MADNSELASEGSDIDAGSEDDETFIGLNLGQAVLQEVQQDNDEDLCGFFKSDSDSDADFEGFHNEWIEHDFDPHLIRQFNGNPEASEQQPEEAQPVQYFSMVWDEEVWTHLVAETNRYAEQERTRNPPLPNALKWTPVDIPTMKAFIGLVFCMGILRLPHLYDYWRQRKPMFRTAFNNIMPRDRFSQIWRYLHLHNNHAPQPVRPDRLVNLRWLVEHLNQTFTDAYTPNGTVTIDKSMIEFKGRLGFRQHLPAKPVKGAVRMWSLAESTTGYLHRFQIYTGKEDRQEKGLTYRVVMDLTEHLEQKYVRLYMDNSCTSVELLEDLVVHGIYGCGTLRSNCKGLPTALLPKNVKLNKHDYKVAQKNELTFCIWQDTEPVLVLSNFHDPDGYVNRQSGQGSTMCKGT